MDLKILFQPCVYIIVIAVFYFLDKSHIHPKNETIWDPIKMLIPLPFKNKIFKEKPVTFKAKCVIYIMTIVLALQIFM